MGGQPRLADFVLTVFWTAYPAALGWIASTLAAPLFIAAIGIVMRGGACAPAIGRLEPARTECDRHGLLTSSSMLRPFALGAAVGACAATAWLIIGFGLLNVADPRSAHAVGVASLSA